MYLCEPATAAALGSVVFSSISFRMLGAFGLRDFPVYAPRLYLYHICVFVYCIHMEFHSTVSNSIHIAERARVFFTFSALAGENQVRYWRERERIALMEQQVDGDVKNA